MKKKVVKKEPSIPKSKIDLEDDELPSLEDLEEIDPTVDELTEPKFKNLDELASDN